MMVKGRRLYGWALRKMALSLPIAATDEAPNNVVIIASKILALFEVSLRVHVFVDSMMLNIISTLIGIF